MTSQFNRFVLRSKRTLAFYRFKSHHAELNRFYWSHVPASALAERALKSTNLPAAQALGYTRSDSHRVPATALEWVESFKGFKNWVRLGCVMSLASLVEFYVRTAVSLALESDPGLAIGAPNAVDGVRLLKRGSATVPEQLITACIKGDWQGRLSAYKMLFGRLPQYVADHSGELEALRKIRNAIGHTVGRDGDFSIMRDDYGHTEQVRVSHDRLLTFLEVAMESADQIDQHLGGAHIGEYESLLMFHTWRDSWHDRTGRRPEHC